MDAIYRQLYVGIYPKLGVLCVTFNTTTFGTQPNYFFIVALSRYDSRRINWNDSELSVSSFLGLFQLHIQIKPYGFISLVRQRILQNAQPIYHALDHDEAKANHQISSFGNH